VGAFWINRSYFQQIILVLVLLLTKNAFDIELRNIQEAYLPGAQEFPQAVGYFSASFGQVVIASGLGITTTTQWVILHVVLIVIALGVAFYLISKEDTEQRSFMILVLASATATSSLFVSIGKYDVITYLGAVIVALSRTLPGASVGALIMASGNPEQALVASAAMLALSVAPEFRKLRFRALSVAAVAASAWFAVQVWFRASGVESSRLSILTEYLGESVARVMAYPGMALWSWMGVGWLIVLASLFVVARTSRTWILIALVVIPGIATLITADGGRVFGLVVLPAYLSALVTLGRSLDLRQPEGRGLIGAFVLSLMILPVGIQGGDWLFLQIFGRM